MTDTRDFFARFSAADASGPEPWADPYPFYRQAREEDPVHFSERFGAWFLTRYSDVAQALQSPSLSSRRADTKFAALPQELREASVDFKASLSRWMLFTDPPEHTRIRALTNKVFSSLSVERVRPRIEQVVDRLLSAVEPSGRMDVIHDLASPLPREVIVEMMATEPLEGVALKQWADDIAAFVGAGIPTPGRSEAAIRSWQEMTSWLRGVTARHRAEPQRDLISILLTPDAKGEVLPEETILATCVMLLTGGHETTHDSISLCALTLMRDEDAMRKLRDSPDLIPSAVEELLRHDSPVQAVGRKAAEDVLLGGKLISKGQPVFPVIGAANRDPARFSDPDRVDFGRTQGRHVAFGAGPHFCVDGALGLLETQIAIEALLRRMPRLRLTGEPLDWKVSLLFRGVRSLPVTF
jgi:cytochrome P450